MGRMASTRSVRVGVPAKPARVRLHPGRPTAAECQNPFPLSGPAVGLAIITTPN
jgi:hypothetical protein